MYFIRDILAFGIKIILYGLSVHLVRKYINKLKKEKIEFAMKISTSELHTKSKSVANHEDRYISKTDRNQTRLAIIMCTFSFFENILYVVPFILFFLKSDLTRLFYYLDILSLSLKHLSNFFVFYRFNYVFRSELKKSLLNICKSNKNIIT